jgi:hypothetical protein
MYIVAMARSLIVPIDPLDFQFVKTDFWYWPTSRVELAEDKQGPIK